MAVATIAKSEFRRDYTIHEGYAAVPWISVHGVTGWVMIGGEITFREREARKYARTLDACIRRNMKDPSQLLKRA